MSPDPLAQLAALRVPLRVALAVQAAVDAGWRVATYTGLTTSGLAQVVVFTPRGADPTPLMAAGFRSRRHGRAWAWIWFTDPEDG